MGDRRRYFVCSFLLEDRIVKNILDIGRESSGKVFGRPTIFHWALSYIKGLSGKNTMLKSAFSQQDFGAFKERATFTSFCHKDQRHTKKQKIKKSNPETQIKYPVFQKGNDRVHKQKHGKNKFHLLKLKHRQISYKKMLSARHHEIIL